MLTFTTLRGKPIIEAYALPEPDKDRLYHVDRGIKPLVDAINDIEGIATHSSCAGHRGPQGRIWKGYKQIKNPDRFYWHDNTGVVEEGVTLAASLSHEWNGMQGELNVGVVFKGERDKVLDYADFLQTALRAYSYGRDVLEFLYYGKQDNQTYMNLRTNHQRIREYSVGFLEMMAQWAVAAHLSERYCRGERNVPNTEERDEKQNSRPIIELMKLFEEHNIFGTCGRTDFRMRLQKN